MTEPLVCVPRAAGTKPAATAAAEPLDDPPGVWSGFQGFLVFPGERKAHSVVTVFPMTKAPRASSRSITAADSVGMWPAKAGEPICVGMPAVAKMSFTPIGSPWRRPGAPPEWSRRSQRRAASIASSGLSQVQAWIASSADAILSRRARVYCFGGEPPVLDPLRGFNQAQGVQGLVHD